MATMTATEAKNRFGQLLEMAQAEPVHVQKDGRDVGVMISPEQYRRLVELEGKPKINPMVEKLHA
ncbi:MAG: type II toxin-antitoxin system Phd/YefM family antitoxin, partial [Devosia sp.]